MPSHHSQSGPVKVIARFDPRPPTPRERLQRLRHKLALIEDRIAARQSYHPTPFRHGIEYNSAQLSGLLLQRTQTQAEIALLESGE